jgi:hypothetical protein
MRQESDRNRGQRQQEETRGQKDIGGSNIPNIAEQKKQGQQTSYVPHETTSHKKPTLGGLEDSSMPDATLRSKDVPDMSESIANRLKDKGFSDKDYGEYAEARDNDYAMSYEDRRMEVGGIVDSEMDKKGKIMWEGPAMKKLDDAIMNKLRGPGPKKEEK